MLELYHIMWLLVPKQQCARALQKSKLLAVIVDKPVGAWSAELYISDIQLPKHTLYLSELHQ